MEWRYAETHGGAGAPSTGWAVVRRARRRDAFWRLRVDDPGASRMFDAPVYQRGAMALQALRHRVGRGGVLDDRSQLAGLPGRRQRQAIR